MNPKDLDSLLEERFGAFNRKALESQVQAHDKRKPKLAFDKAQLLRRLSFGPGLPEKIVAILQHLIPAVLEFCAEHGMALRESAHEIRFLDVTGYSNEFHKPFPPNVPLPASQLQYHATAKTYKIFIILPPKIQTIEEIVNITRTLFAKFMGELYLEEQILGQEFYQAANRYQETQFSAGFPDQVQVIFGSDFPSPTLESYLSAYAKRLRLPPKASLAGIKRDLAQDWLQKWERQQLPPQEHELIQRIFQDFLAAIRANPEAMVQRLIEELEKLNAQIHFIVPHEKKAYHLFEQKSLIHYLRAGANKLEELLATLGFVEEVASKLQTPLNWGELELLDEQLQAKMLVWKREGKVRVFLLPDATLNEALRAEQQRFPLRLMGLLPPNLPVAQWGKAVRTMQKAYESTLYLKLFEACRMLRRWIKASREQQTEAFLESSDYARLKPLLHNFKFREPHLRQLQQTLGVVVDYYEVIQGPPPKKTFPLAMFRKAWSYFISCVLIHLYYSQSSLDARQPRMNTEKYLKAIEQFVLQQMKHGPNFYHLVYLFLLVYQQIEPPKLEFLLFLIRNPQATLRYTVIQALAPHPEPLPPLEDYQKRLEKLQHYSTTLVNAYRERWQLAILPGRDYPLPASK